MEPRPKRPLGCSPPAPEARTEIWGPQLALSVVFLYVAAASAAKAMATANPNSNFGFRIGFGLGGLSNLLVLAVVWLVVGGIAYLGFRRRGGVTFTQAIFTWPVIGVTAIMGLLFIFA